MNEAEPIKSNPKNEYLEEENRLLSLNIKELASLNDNVNEMSVNLENIVIDTRNMMYINTIKQYTSRQRNNIGTKLIF